MATLITISGLAGAGKDSAAWTICNRLHELGKTSAVISFGDFPKQAMAEILNKTVEDLFGTNELKNKNRPFLIQYAQMMKYFAGDTVWAKQLLDKVGFVAYADFVIVPDLRFQEELLVMNDFNGPMFNLSVEREAVLPTDVPWLKEGYAKGLLVREQLYQYHNIEPSHNPMAYMDKESFDWVFDNNGEVSELMAQINEFIKIKLNNNGKVLRRVGRTLSERDS